MEQVSHPSPLSFQEAVRAGVLPFAIAQQWNAPCAYERSIKVTTAGLLPNRYLISVDSDLLKPQQVQDACLQLGMPANFTLACLHRFPKASQFMMGFEESHDEAVLKVYLETCNAHRRSILSHVGWKWRLTGSATLSGSAKTDLSRVTLYRRLRPNVVFDWVHSIEDNLASQSSPSLWLLPLLEPLGAALGQVTCLEVIEEGSVRGLDLNLYPLHRTVAAWRGPIEKSLTALGLNLDYLEQLLALCGPRQLGHVSVGQGYLTVYYM